MNIIHMVVKKPKIKKPNHNQGSGNFGFGAMLGYQGVQSKAMQLRNMSSSNDKTTYNPFRQMLEATGADDF